MANFVYCKNSSVVSRNMHDNEDVMLVSRSSKIDYYLMLVKVNNTVIGPVKELNRDEALEKINNFSNQGGKILLYDFSDKREARDFLTGKTRSNSLEKPLYVAEGESINKYSFSFENDGEFRSLLNKIYENEVSSSRAEISFSNLIDNRKLYSLVKHPVVINPSYDVFIPEYGYDNPSLYYVLSGLSNDSTEEIYVGYKELEKIEKANSEDNLEFVKKFLSLIKVKHLETIDKKDFMRFLDDFEKYGNKAKIVISHELIQFRNILESSEKNNKLLDRLGLLNKKEEKGNKKALTT